MPGTSSTGARRFDTIREAVADCGMVVGTTCRKGLYRDHVELPREVAQDLVAAVRGDDSPPAALLFGPEDHGLSNVDLKHCQRLITIPSHPEQPSLNLAQAVMVCLYEIYLAAAAGPAREERIKRAPAEAVEALFDRMKETLLKVGFLDPQNPEHILLALRRVLGRAGLEERDVKILSGLFRQVEWYTQGGWGSGGRKTAAGDQAAVARPRPLQASFGPDLLKLFQRPRPILLQETRQRSVCQQPSSGLAPGAVVALVGRVTDPLNASAALGARLPVPPVHRHARTKRGDLLGEIVPGLLAEPAAPVLKHLAHRGMERFDLRLVEMARLLHRRQPGAMEDLVGIGVTDAAEQTRVGERTLQRVVLAPQHTPEIVQTAVQHLDAAGIVLSANSRGTAHGMQRRTLDGARLGEDQGAGRQIESRQAQLARNASPRRAPAKPPGDHQVEDQEEIALKLEDDALAQPVETQDLPVLGTPVWAGRRTGAGTDS